MCLLIHISIRAEGPHTKAGLTYPTMRLAPFLERKLSAKQETPDDKCRLALTPSSALKFRRPQRPSTPS